MHTPITVLINDALADPLRPGALAYENLRTRFAVLALECMSDRPALQTPQLLADAQTLMQACLLEGLDQAYGELVGKLEQLISEALCTGPANAKSCTHDLGAPSGKVFTYCVPDDSEESPAEPRGNVNCDPKISTATSDGTLQVSFEAPPERGLRRITPTTIAFVLDTSGPMRRNAYSLKTMLWTAQALLMSTTGYALHDRQRESPDETETAFLLRLAALNVRVVVVAARDCASVLYDSNNRTQPRKFYTLGDSLPFSGDSNMGYVLYATASMLAPDHNNNIIVASDSTAHPLSHEFYTRAFGALGTIPWMKTATVTSFIFPGQTNVSMHGAILPAEFLAKLGPIFDAVDTVTAGDMQQLFSDAFCSAVRNVMYAEFKDVVVSFECDKPASPAQRTLGVCLSGHKLSASTTLRLPSEASVRVTVRVQCMNLLTNCFMHLVYAGIVV